MLSIRVFIKFRRNFSSSRTRGGLGWCSFFGRGRGGTGVDVAVRAREVVVCLSDSEGEDATGDALAEKVEVIHK